MFSNAPFQSILFDNKTFIVKRDDLIHSKLNGNKAFKLAYLLDSELKTSNITKLVSFGGCQSNFMLALSRLAIIKGLQFDYWVRTLPKFLKANPCGNLKSALKDNMKLIERLRLPDITELHHHYNSDQTLILDQGGRMPSAEYGMKRCAKQIIDYTSAQGLTDYSVFVPSGTGTTAVYLAKYLPIDTLYTTPCIVDENDLKRQMQSLDIAASSRVQILNPCREYRFGGLYFEHLALYQQLLSQTAIEFELLYDPQGWQVLLSYYDKLPKPVIYLHCGGTEGNETMLKRYRRNGMLKP
ncbi:MAG: 1-aminocyclopropane-1-carboxylate deaminase [Francisellaceae bacterium]